MTQQRRGGGRGVAVAQRKGRGVVRKATQPPRHTAGPAPIPPFLPLPGVLPLPLPGGLLLQHQGDIWGNTAAFQQRRVPHEDETLIIHFDEDEPPQQGLPLEPNSHASAPRRTTPPIRMPTPPPTAEPSEKERLQARIRELELVVQKKNALAGPAQKSRLGGAQDRSAAQEAEDFLQSMQTTGVTEMAFPGQLDDTPGRALRPADQQALSRPASAGVVLNPVQNTAFVAPPFDLGGAGAAGFVAVPARRLDPIPRARAAHSSLGQLPSTELSGGVEPHGIPPLPPDPPPPVPVDTGQEVVDSVFREPAAEELVVRAAGTSVPQQDPEEGQADSDTADLPAADMPRHYSGSSMDMSEPSSPSSPSLSIGLAVGPDTTLEEGEKAVLLDELRDLEARRASLLQRKEVLTQLEREAREAYLKVMKRLKLVHERLGDGVPDDVMPQPSAGKLALPHPERLLQQQRSSAAEAARAEDIHRRRQQALRQRDWYHSNALNNASASGGTPANSTVVREAPRLTQPARADPAAAPAPASLGGRPPQLPAPATSAAGVVGTEAQATSAARLVGTEVVLEGAGPPTSGSHRRHQSDQLADQAAAKEVRGVRSSTEATSSIAARQASRNLAEVSGRASKGPAEASARNEGGTASRVATRGDKDAADEPGRVSKDVPGRHSQQKPHVVSGQGVPTSKGGTSSAQGTADVGGPDKRPSGASTSGKAQETRKAGVGSAAGVRRAASPTAARADVAPRRQASKEDDALRAKEKESAREREKERERGKERAREREKEKQKQKQREAEREKERERGRARARGDGRGRDASGPRGKSRGDADAVRDRKREGGQRSPQRGPTQEPGRSKPYELVRHSPPRKRRSPTSSSPSSSSPSSRSVTSSLSRSPRRGRPPSPPRLNSLKTAGAAKPLLKRKRSSSLSSSRSRGRFASSKNSRPRTSPSKAPAPAVVPPKPAEASDKSQWSQPLEAAGVARAAGPASPGIAPFKLLRPGTRESRAKQTADRFQPPQGTAAPQVVSPHFALGPQPGQRPRDGKPATRQAPVGTASAASAPAVVPPKPAVAMSAAASAAKVALSAPAAGTRGPGQPGVVAKNAQPRADVGGGRSAGGEAIVEGPIGRVPAGMAVPLTQERGAKPAQPSLPKPLPSGVEAGKGTPTSKLVPSGLETGKGTSVAGQVGPTPQSASQGKPVAAPPPRNGTTLSMSGSGVEQGAARPGIQVSPEFAATVESLFADALEASRTLRKGGVAGQTGLDAQASAPVQQAAAPGASVRAGAGTPLAPEAVSRVARGTPLVANASGTSKGATLASNAAPVARGTPHPSTAAPAPSAVSQATPQAGAKRLASGPPDADGPPRSAKKPVVFTIAAEPGQSAPVPVVAGRGTSKGGALPPPVLSTQGNGTARGVPLGPGVPAGRGGVIPTTVARPKAAGRGGGITIVVASSAPKGTKQDAALPVSAAGVVVGMGPLRSRVNVDPEQVAPAEPVSKRGRGGQKRAAQMEGTKYQSPLLPLKTYRLLPTYASMAHLPLTSALYVNHINPHWQLCPFEMRGECKDPGCAFQMASDYALRGPAVLEDVRLLAERANAPARSVPAGVKPLLEPGDPALEAAAAALLEGADEMLLPQAKQQGRQAGGWSAAASATVDQQGRPAKRMRLTPKQLHEQCFERSVPEYQLWDREARHRLFRSSLLSPAPLAPVAYPWDQMPGWQGYERSQPPAGPAQQQREDTRVLQRYFSDAVPAGGLPSAGAHAVEEGSQGLPKFLEDDYSQAVQAAPTTVELWLSWAYAILAQPVAQGKVDGQRTWAMKVVSRALEKTKTSCSLWLVFVHLFSRYRPTALKQGASPKETAEAAASRQGAVVRIAESAVEFSEPCHRVYVQCSQLMPDSRRCIFILQRGIIALASVDPGSPEACKMRAAGVLDLALRYMQLLGANKNGEALAIWLNALLRDVPFKTTQQDGRMVVIPKLPVAAGGPPKTPEEEAREQAAFAKTVAVRGLQGLLLCLGHHPPLAAVFWLSVAHLSAWGTLPDQVVHRLGYVQEPFVLTWRPAPAQASVARIRAILDKSLGASLGCLPPRHVIVTAASEVPGAASYVVARQSIVLSLAHLVVVSSVSGESVGPSGTGLPEDVMGVLKAGAMLPRVAEGIAVPVSQPARSALEAADLLPYRASLAQLGATAEVPGILKGLRDLDVRDALCIKHHIDTEAAKQMQGRGAAAGAAASKAAAQGPPKRPTNEERLLAARQILMQSAQSLPGPAVRNPPQGAGGMLPRVHPAAVGMLAAHALRQSKGKQKSALAILAASVLDPPMALASSAAAPGPLSEANGLPAHDRRGRNPSARGRSGNPPRSPAHSRSRSRDRRGDRGPSPSRRRSWHTLAGAVSMAAHADVREAFAALLTPPVTEEAMDYEEGEIADAEDEPEDWGPEELAFTWLNLALYEAVSGCGKEALAACQSALSVAEGRPKLEAAVWEEYIVIAALILLSERPPSQGVSHFIDQQVARLMGKRSQASAGAAAPQEPGKPREEAAQPSVSGMLQVPSAPLPPAQSQQRSNRADCLAAFLRILQAAATRVFATDICTPLCFPLLRFKDPVVCQALGTPPAQACGLLTRAVERVLPLLQRDEVVIVAERMYDLAPTSPDVAVFLSEVASMGPSSPLYSAWALPLLAGALANAVPTTSPSVWFKAVLMTEHQSAAAARELCGVAAAHHPRSNPLLEKLASLKAAHGASRPSGTSA